jgi:ATP-dependent helicase/nuclease subunit B
MAKTLLVGPAGCGKTHTVLDEFERALRSGDPLNPDAFFVVPSAEHTERVVSLLIQRGAKGFFHKRVTTLSRLASGLFQAADVPVASSLTRTMILREIFAENDWEYFREVKDQSGFLNLILQFVSELKESCVDAGKFRDRMNGLKKFEPAYGTKYEALAAIYENYEAKLKGRGFRDAQDGLALYLERRSQGLAAPVRFRALCLDGFFDFSNLQLEYLRILSSMTEDMTVTLTKEEGAGREEAFEIIETTQKNLEAIGFKAQTMKPVNFRTKVPALLHLQNNLFKGSGGPGTVPVLRDCPSLQKKGQAPFLADKEPVPHAITFLDAVGIEGEIELIAREIHKLYAAGDCRYSDFAVLFRQVRNYGRVIESIFARYGIPTEIHERRFLRSSAKAGNGTIFSRSSAPATSKNSGRSRRTRNGWSGLSPGLLGRGPLDRGTPGLIRGAGRTAKKRMRPSTPGSGRFLRSSPSWKTVSGLPKMLTGTSGSSKKLFTGPSGSSRYLTKTPRPCGRTRCRSGGSRRSLTRSAPMS